MKKKIFIFLFLIIFFLAGCNIKSTPTADESYSSFNYSYTDGDYKYLGEVFDELKIIIDNAKTSEPDKSTEEKFGELYDWLGTEEANLAYYKTVEEINYYMTGNSSYSDKQQYFYEIILELIDKKIDLYEPVYQSNLKELFYEGWTDAEIEKYIEKEKIEKASLPLYKEQNELQNKALIIRDANQMKPVLVDIIKLNNRIGKLYGYNNYLEYAYPNVYGRGYNVNDAKTLIQNVNDYVYPFLEEISDTTNDLIGTITYADYNQCRQFEQVSYKDYYNVIDSYTKALGGNVNTTFNNLLNSKYFFVATNPNAIEAAWTNWFTKYNTPMMYMGFGYYRSVNTFIHEFGHYISMDAYKSSGNDYDFAETQSQSNEALFQIYLRDNYTKLSKNALKYLNYNWLLDKLDSVVTCACVGACELALYTEDNVTVDNIDSLCKNSIKKYFPSLTNISGITEYAILCSAASAGYYISYTTSAISSISVYKNGLNDFNNTAKNYLELIKIGDCGAYPKELSALNIVNAFNKKEVENLMKISNFR